MRYLTVCIGLGLLTTPKLYAQQSEKITKTESDNGSIPEVIQVVGHKSNLVGEAISASQGLIGQEEIKIRPLLRTGEILESIPGMVVTQHSGTGKANQYFLRGFNLDHGTDFATFVDGMPVNMRTHGHGQGYSDLNFVIPELIGSIEYKKGPYYAEVGDFSGAGSAQLRHSNILSKGTASITLGEDNYQRYLMMDSIISADSSWTYALEYNSSDGPWTDIKEDLDKTNAVIKHQRDFNEGELSLTFMAYDNSWNSADQIPQRAVDSGLIDKFGSIDPTVGGQSSRYSLSANWINQNWQFSAYVIDYDLNLWGNFTYFMEDPINGDQIEQVDQRMIYGGNANYQFEGEIAGKDMTNRIGIEFRYDDISEVALYKTKQKQRLGAIRQDDVAELSFGLYWENQLELTDNLRSTLGLRYDIYDFDVNSKVDNNIYDVDLSGNSGKTDDSLLSAKFSLSYTINEHLEVYSSLGQGFHSNDARGTTVKIDAIDGSVLEPVAPLVESFGGEIGLRSVWSDKANISLALWFLDLDSELIFVGDAGNTEPSGKSKRKGLELTTYYYFDDIWTLDVEFALAESKYSDEPNNANEIPGAIDKVLQLGLSADWDNGFFGSMRLRYFGDRPLNESGELRSASTKVVNMRLGYHIKDWTFKVDLLNLLASDTHDIDYYYESQLVGEPQPIGDFHFHPIESRTYRASVSYHF
jgi:outer membrane receptor protein involved in Fe transport